MTIDADALSCHAAAVSRERLERARGRLARLSRAELAVVEETAEAIGQAVALCLLESATEDESLESVLAGLYPTVGASAVPG
jgi:hypothetical protein